jgi:bacterioferritin-associated ferredoxin
MLVCKCLKVNFDAIEAAVSEVGTDMSAVMEKTDAGMACGCCKNDACGKVELPLPKAIEKAGQQ